MPPNPKKSIQEPKQERVITCPGDAKEIKIWFTQDSEVRFITDKGKTQWYGSDYGVGTYISVRDIISASNEHLYVLCLDGEKGVLDLGHITFNKRELPKGENGFSNRESPVVSPGKYIRK